MRVLALLLLVALPVALASEPYVTLVDWVEGDSLVGTTRLAMSPLAERFPFDVDACHRVLLLDLLYEPDEGGADAPGVGEVFLQFDFLVEVWRGDTRLSQRLVQDPAYGHGLGTTPAAGAHEVRLSLANGADVSWELRVRGREVFGELACEPRVVLNEVELDPAGPDAGAQWVEVLNAADMSVDMSGWTIEADGGVVHAFAQGASLGPGERVVVAFDAALPHAATLALFDGLGNVRDPGAALADADDDARTWQRAPDGGDAWSFAAGTPGAPNSS